MRKNYVLHAVLIGAACLFIVVQLAISQRNKPTTKIKGSSEAEALHNHSSHGNIEWPQVLDGMAESLSLPDVVAAYLNPERQLNMADTGLLTNAILFCAKNQFLVPAAYLELRKSSLVQNEIGFTNATEALYKAAVMSQDSLLRSFLMKEVSEVSSLALNENKQNLNANLYRGLAMADEQATIMQGVPHLLEVIKLDPNHLLANYTLGLLGIESGQYDKALLRFEKLISLQPSNLEYFLQAARTAKLAGEIEKSEGYYQQAISLTNDEKVKKQIEELKKQ